jgi:PAS domain S-box-containing protein
MVATLICLILFLYVSSSVIVMNGFTQVEKQDTQKNVQRVQEALSDELSVLNGVVGDWAAWNETYNFVNGENPNFIKEQIADRTFIEIRLNLMLFINSTGGVVYGSGFDLKNNKAVPIPAGIKEYLSADSILLRHQDTKSNITGIILLPEGPMLVASRPILTNEGVGPIRGSVIWGRYLDDKKINELGTKTHLTVAVHLLNDSNMPSDFVSMRNSFSKQETILVRPLSEESIAGYTILKDINGAPALILRVNMPRAIYQQGQASIYFYFITLLIIGLIFGGMSMFLLEKQVLSRLARLNSDVVNIGISGDFSKHLVVEGADELSSLAGSINTMTNELKISRDHLENLVEERTKELKIINEQLQKQITERIEAEEELKDSEERYRTIIEHSNDLIWTLDVEGRFMFINKYAEKISGYRSQDWVGKSFAPLLNKEDLPYNFEMFQKILKGLPQQYEVSVNREDGSFFILAVNSAPLYSKGQIIGTVSFGRDITEIKKSEKIILRSLEEKEVLLREIHHRVKNNMQIVSSLLRLQSQNIEDKKYRDIFIDSQNRIHAMALIHEKLYQSESLAQINFKEYIDGIVSNIFESYGQKSNIKLDINIENILINIDNAVPCGLIINELVTNSLKYAFPDGRQGIIKISVKSNDNGLIQLSISDDGIGIPKDLDIRNTKTLGLTLITALAENQLNGELIINREKGTEFQINFRGTK